MECLRKTADRMPFLEALEKRTGVKREYSLLGLGLFFLVIIMATALGPIITSTVGIIVPLQETLVVLKQVNPKREEIRHLLVFWMVFGLLASLDAYSTPIIGLIPLWYTIKFFFLLWAGPLRFRAGLIIYDNVLAPVPEEWYSGKCGIDSAVKKATDTVKNVAESELAKDGNTSPGDKKAD